MILLLIPKKLEDRYITKLQEVKYFPKMVINQFARLLLYQKEEIK